MITRAYARLRRLRRWVSRSEWSVRWLKLGKENIAPDEPGLLLIQIDGLGYHDFNKALEAGRLPFLRRLLNREHYQLKSLYSGVPSTTPAVQAELFYGVRTSLPAFSYLDPEDGSLVKLFDPVSAHKVEERLLEQSEGLIADGAAYGNIFGGGAAESETHFCVSALGWNELRRALNPLTFVLLVLVNIPGVLRVLGLLVVEVVLAGIDFVKGAFKGESILAEAKFILARVGVTIGLREMIAMGASMDLARGLPIVQLNLAAFDEQSHRRGPSSRFAHWGLKGIDRTIRRLWLEAKRSPAREYRVWIYSDHGQEDVVPYQRLAGSSIQQVVAELVPEVLPEVMTEGSEDEVGNDESWDVVAETGTWYRARTLRQDPREPLPDYASRTAIRRPHRPRVVAMGPVGFIYCPRPIGFEQKAALAMRLTRDHQVPCALAFDEQGELFAWTSGERLSLPADRERLIGHDHPFADWVYDDIAALCRHPGAGDLVITGWCAGKQPVSFPMENGSHGGFGPRETQGIVLVDSDRELPHRSYSHLRASDIRMAALKLLQHSADPDAEAVGTSTGDRCADAGPTRLRVMTYNIHSCVGMDGRHSPARIARLIGQYQPDIVALQEVDNGRERSGTLHHASSLAEQLDMHFLYLPLIAGEEGEYGIALLSRWPLQQIRAERLPGLSKTEPRGAIWAQLDTGCQAIQFIVTHLGLGVQERRAQIDRLMGEEWAGAALKQGSLVFMGDLNASPRSYVCRQAGRMLDDVQKRTGPGGTPFKTWVSTRPTRRIDHIFVSPTVEVMNVMRPQGYDFRMASDHLPLLAELQFHQPAQHPAE